MDVAKVMRTKLVLAGPDCPFTELLHKIASPASRQVYIVDDQYRLQGVVSAKDLFKEIMPSYMNADLARSITDEADFLQRQIDKVKDVRARDIMTSKLISLHPYHQLLEADALFAEHGFNTLPVLDKQGKILGEITRRDILTQLLDKSVRRDDEETVDVSSV